MILDELNHEIADGYEQRLVGRIDERHRHRRNRGEDRADDWDELRDASEDAKGQRRLDVDREQENSRHRTDDQHGDELRYQPPAERRRQSGKGDGGAVSLAERYQLEDAAVIKRGIDRDVRGDEEHQQ